MGSTPSSYSLVYHLVASLDVPWLVSYCCLMTNRHSLSTIMTAALVPALFAGVAIAGMTNTAPEGGFVGYDHAIGRDSNIAPKVDLPANCTTKPFLTDKVMVIPNDYAVPAPLTYTLDQALREGKAGKVWVVGYCS